MCLCSAGFFPPIQLVFRKGKVNDGIKVLKWCKAAVFNVRNFAWIVSFSAVITFHIISIAFLIGAMFVIQMLGTAGWTPAWMFLLFLFQMPLFLTGNFRQF